MTYTPSKLKPEKKQELQETLNGLNHLTGLIQGILNGTCSQTEAARQLHATIQAFNNDSHLHRQIHKIVHTDSRQMQEYLYSLRTPYEKLVYNIFGITPQDPVLILPDDVNEHLEKLMKKYLNAQEEQFVKLRFGIPDQGEQTLEQIGNRFHLTRERVRQSLNKSLHKLRNIELYKKVLSNYDVCMQSISELPMLEALDHDLKAKYDETELLKDQLQLLAKQVKANEEQLAQIENILSPQLTDINKDTLPDSNVWTQLQQLHLYHRKDFQHISDRQLAACLHLMDKTTLWRIYLAMKLPYPTDTIRILQLPLEELNLSVRLYHCLKQHGNTVGDILLKTKEEIQNTRNMGVRSYEELLNVFQTLGLSLEDTNL